MSAICPVEGCEKLKPRPNGNGYCYMHSTRLRKHGTLDDPRRSSTELFWEKVHKTEGCWNWTGSSAAHGYGNLTLRNPRRSVRAHRFSYELAHGPIEPGLVIDHTCHNTLCVNPDHLRAVTQKQNTENRGGLSANNTSGFRGVTWHVGTKKWMASLAHNGKRVYVGVFDDAAEAGAAVAAKRNELFTHNDQDRQQQQAS